MIDINNNEAECADDLRLEPPPEKSPDYSEMEVYLRELAQLEEQFQEMERERIANEQLMAEMVAQVLESFNNNHEEEKEEEEEEYLQYDDEDGEETYKYVPNGNVDQVGLSDMLDEDYTGGDY